MFLLNNMDAIKFRFPRMRAFWIGVYVFMRRNEYISPPTEAPRPSNRYILATCMDGILLSFAAIFDISIKTRPKRLQVTDRETKDGPNIWVKPMICPDWILSIDFIRRMKNILSGTSMDMASNRYERSFSLDCTRSRNLPSTRLPNDTQKSHEASIMPRESSLP